MKEGWIEDNLPDGQMPKCYNFKRKTGKYANYLDISVGTGTSVVVKLINKATNNCVRYVFVNSQSNYRISNIPPGIYYLKIAYGTNWFSKNKNGKCIGRFLNHPLYKISSEFLDYRIQPTADGYNIPSFSLHLDVKTTNRSDQYLENNISEDEFNN